MESNINELLEKLYPSKLWCKFCFKNLKVERENFTITPENLKLLDYSTIKFEYFTLLVFLVFSIFLSALILFLSYYLTQQNPNSEKLSAYECGFEPYDDSRHPFDIKFCVIAILFVVFDVEIMFLIPWCVSISDLNLLGIWVLMDFLFELFVGFFYVWYSGSLDWQSKK